MRCQVPSEDNLRVADDSGIASLRLILFARKPNAIPSKYRAYSIVLGFLVVTFQNLYDGDYGVPIPCRRPHTEQFVDLPKIAHLLHVTTVHSKDVSLFRCNNSHEPLTNQVAEVRMQRKPRRGRLSTECSRIEQYRGVTGSPNATKPQSGASNFGSVIGSI
jgi:hypothetical protein